MVAKPLSLALRSHTLRDVSIPCFGQIPKEANKEGEQAHPLHGTKAQRLGYPPKCIRVGRAGNVMKSRPSLKSEPGAPFVSLWLRENVEVMFPGCVFGNSAFGVSALLQG